MNEAETRAELIDPKLKACGWGVVEGSKILREYNITAGKIQKNSLPIMCWFTKELNWQ
jgi:type I restriction enzyme R subunit